MKVKARDELVEKVYGILLDDCLNNYLEVSKIASRLYTKARAASKTQTN